MSNYKIYQDKYYKFKYIDKIYEINDISPPIEKQRELILNDIQHHFKKIIKKYISLDLIKGKHSVDRVLETMLARFLMGQLSHPDNRDPVIPNNITSYQSLKEDLKVKLRKDKTKRQDEIEKIVSNIIKKLDLQHYLNEFVYIECGESFDESDFNGIVYSDDNGASWSLISSPAANIEDPDGGYQQVVGGSETINEPQVWGLPTGGPSL